MSRTLAPGMKPPWPKGQSGNPLGSSVVHRRFQAAIRDRSHDGKKLLDYLFVTLADPLAHPIIRFKCCELLIKYGYGEPRPAEDTQGLQIDATKLNDSERESLIALLARLGLQGERPSNDPESHSPENQVS